MNLSPTHSSLWMRLTCFSTTVLLLGISVLGYSQDVRPFEAQTPAPKKQIRIMRPQSGPIDSNRLRDHRVSRAMEMQNQPRANNTGSGVIYTCDPTVASFTCEYLNTTIANYYNSTFTNANANIYIQYGTTNLGESEQYYNFITWAQYLSAINAITNKTAVQISALSALNTYDATPYSGDNVEVTAALGMALGYPASDFAGIDTGGGSCTPGTSGCYNAIITITNDPGTPLYYDNQGGAEPADAYDFYAVVMHETDETLGTSSCIDIEDGTALTDPCDGATSSGGPGTPSAVDLYRYSSAGELVLDSALSQTAGAYFSYNGGTTNGANGIAGTPKVYNTLFNGEDYADFVSSSPDCGTDIAIQDAVGCPGEDMGLTILNDGGGEINILNAVGYSLSPAPAVTLSASSLSFGSLSAGTTGASQSVTLTNSGNAALSIASFVITGAGASQFVFAENCGSTLAAGTTCIIHGHFAPTGAGADSAAIIITDNAGNSPQSISLSGTGVSAPVAQLSATSLTFGNEDIGSITASQYITLTNPGLAPLSIASIAVTGPGASQFVFADSCGSTLAAGGNCSIHGHFAPTTAGAATAAITITDNAGNSPQSVSLSGTGVALPIVKLSATSLTFGSLAIGSLSGSATVTLTNVGSATLSISSIALTRANASSWVFANSCGTSLAAGANCIIHGHFAPLADGALTAAIQITDNASGSPQSISLSGTGTGTGQPAVKLTATSLSFGTVNVGSSGLSQSVTLTNSGTAALAITSISLTGVDPGSWVFANTCGTTLAIGANCTIHGHFAPTTAGPLTAAITITDNAAGSPQTISLSGTGQ
jgi:centrosomal CEP192-like protein/HYDIN/CFA65/VesB family protein